LTVFGWSQKTVDVTAPTASDKSVVFTSQGVPIREPDSSTKLVNGKAVVTPGTGENYINVWDKGDGRVASTAIAKTKGHWTVGASSFQALASVTVKIESQGSPVGSAEIQFQDGLHRASSFLDPASHGSAKFFDVRLGKSVVTVIYRNDKGSTAQVSQNFSASSSDAEPPVWTVALPDADKVSTSSEQATVPAVSGPAATATGTSTAPPAPTKPPTPASPFGAFLVYLLALVIGVAVVVGAIQLYRRNPGPVASKLAQLGVQIPQPGEQPLSQATPFMPDPLPRAQPVQKIVLQDATPDPIAVAAPSMPMGEPTIVTQDGTVIPLSEGPTAVGRDPGLGLSLTAETTVSRRHAQFSRIGNEVTLEDFASTNGTYVNGVRIQSPVVLNPGDAVQFGSAKFRYQR
jgi:hypothetical protein